MRISTKSASNATAMRYLILIFFNICGL